MIFLGETKLVEINSDSNLEFGEMKCTFFKTSHSIPDCLGIVFHTPEGTVVHTGDFKFDLTPVNNEYPDIHKMAEIGSEGVLAFIIRKYQCRTSWFYSFRTTCR